MRNIRVLPYDPEWAKAYQREVDFLVSILGEALLSIHHVGSTSVPGAPAKPVIDIMPIVRDINELERYYPMLAATGYEPLGENGIPGRRFLIKGCAEQRTHNVHAYEPDHPEVARHLDFRDYLRAHPAVVVEYGRLKMKLAGEFPDDILGYIAGKDAFIKDVLQRARVWRKQQYDEE